MTLRKIKAKNYNRKRGYETRVIRLIQSLVKSSIHGQFDDDTVQAIYDWQGSPKRMTKLAQDGMFGPLSMGCAIAEFQKHGKQLEASLLTPYPHEMPENVENLEDNPVMSFSHRTISDLDLREPDQNTKGVNPQGWVMRGCFEVKIRLNPKISDPSRYEYRQLIRGDSGITDGYFTDDALTIWEPLSSERSLARLFAMPGGLPSTFKEDVQSKNHVESRFGYRSTPNVYKPNGHEGLIDRYLPNREGHLYECRDTFGLQDNRDRVIGMKIRLKLDYFGYIYDKWLQKAVQQKSWSYRRTDFVRA